MTRGVTLLAALAALSAVTAACSEPGSDRAADVPGAFVTERTLQRALESQPPARTALQDDVDFFATRLEDRGGEDPLARRRLVSASTSRHQSYGNPADLDRATRHLETLLSASPNDPALHGSAVALALARHDFAGAVEAAERSMRLARPATTDAQRLRLFDAYLATGRLEEAAGLLDVVTEVSIGSLARRARLADRLGETEAGRDLKRRVVDRARAFSERRSVVAWALTELGHYEFHSGDPGTAVDRYLEALRLLPGSPAALEGLASVAYGADGNPVAAAALYAHALASGGHLDLYLRLAELARERGDEAAADSLASVFVHRAAATPELERLHYRPLALLLADTGGETARALRYAEADLEQRPTAESLATAAWVRYRSGDPDGALARIRRIEGRAVPEPDALYRAGVVAQDLGDSERARAFLRSAWDARAELTTEQRRDLEERRSRITFLASLSR